jgi:hypothetical protein
MVGAQQRILRDGFLFGAGQLRGVGGAERQAEFLEARAQHVFGIVQHGEAAFQPGTPQVCPSRGGRVDAAVKDDAGAAPHVGHAPLQRGVPGGRTEASVQMGQAGEPFVAQRRVQSIGAHGFEAVVGGEHDVPAGIPADDFGQQIRPVGASVVPSAIGVIRPVDAEETPPELFMRAGFGVRVLCRTSTTRPN